MKYVTSVERVAMKRGYEQGLKEGREEGLEEYRQKAFQVALGATALVLELKFGAEGLELLPAFAKAQSFSLFQTVYEAIRGGASLDKLRNLVG